MELVIRRETALTPAMEALRAVVLGCGPGTTRDPFDVRSSHVVAYVDGIPVGMVRETPSCPSVLTSWARGAWSLPTGADVVELTRGVVAERYRRHGVYRLLMLELMAALAADTRIATAAIEADFVGRSFLERVGFAASGDERRFWDAPRDATFAVPIFSPVDAARRNRWRTMLAEWRERMVVRGVAVSGTAAVPCLPLGSGNDARVTTVSADLGALPTRVCAAPAASPADSVRDR